MLLNCTDPPLTVYWHSIIHYSGSVKCGTLVLDKDIGAGIPDPLLHKDLEKRPLIRHATANPSSLYTLGRLPPGPEPPAGECNVCARPLTSVPIVVRQ